MKLADFGLAVVCAKGGFLEGSGTVPYMSPEQLLDSCNESCDMWACGCVFAEMLMGEELVPRACWDDSAKALRLMRRGGLEVRVDSAFLRLVDEEGGPQLLQHLLTYEWSSRLIAKDAVRSAFFHGRPAVSYTHLTLPTKRIV